MALLPFDILLRRLLRPQGLAIFEACVIGLVSGLAAVLLKQGVGALGGWRVQASLLMPVWFLLPAVGLGGGALAGWLVKRFAPEASGSGIPQVKVALARPSPGLNLRVAFTKILTTILVMGSGLTVGRQGPTVQVGAALAGQFSRWVPTSPDHRRQLIASGAAAGLAAGFNAPIAGVLFVIEELLQDFSGITLGTAILASFIGATVSRLLGGAGLSLTLSQTALDTQFSLLDVPLLLLLGALAGLLGGLFNRGIFFSLHLYRRSQLSLPWCVAIAGCISGGLVALLPTEFRDTTGLREYLITGDASWDVQALAFVTKFGLTLVAYGSGAPGGLFAPALILGSALGALVNTVAHNLQALMIGWPIASWALGSPHTYALTGMGAFFSAVTRGPITAIIIVFEMTADFNLALPLMIGSVVASLVAEQVSSGSIYNSLLVWKGIDLTPIKTEGEGWEHLTAADVMQRRVETLSSDVTLDRVIQTFADSHHRGFPVVDEESLVGIVTQGDVANWRQAQLSKGLLGDSDPSSDPGSDQNTTLAEIMTAHPITVGPTTPLSYVLYTLNRYQISRLPVTEGRRLVGIITRADIIRVESEQLSREPEAQRSADDPSYVVYQTRAPAVGKGRILVPLNNPQTVGALLEVAGAIAHKRQYELECLQVIVVPYSSVPSETPVRAITSRRLLQQAVRFGEAKQIPIHTQVRVAHHVGEAILETIKERHINLVLMDWRGRRDGGASGTEVFSNTVETVISQAICDVVLVKWAKADTKAEPSVTQKSQKSESAKLDLPITLPPLNHWLVPLSGGPNAHRAIQLLPSLMALGDRPEISLCQVINPYQEDTDTSTLTQDVAFLSRELSCPVQGVTVAAHSVIDAVLDMAQSLGSDVIVLGASRDGLLQKALKGNIPAAIASKSDRTVILVRGSL